MHVDCLKSWSAPVSSAVSTARLLTALACVAVALPSVAHAQATAPVTTIAVPSKPAPDAKAHALVDKTANDADSVFGRLPCSAPKSLARMDGALAKTARRLALGEPLTIVALGSSSTAGAGASSPEFSYPNRLALEMKRRFPKATVNVINRGANGEETSDMIARLDAIIADKPDLVLWQFGTNAILRDFDTTSTVSKAQQGLARLKSAGIDVLLIDPQFAPKVIAKNAAKDMVAMMSTVAQKARIPVFQRFAVMRHWHDQQDIGFDKFVTADGLHMNDWGYACFARVLGESLADAIANAHTVANASLPNAALLDPF